MDNNSRKEDKQGPPLLKEVYIQMEDASPGPSSDKKKYTYMECDESVTKDSHSPNTEALIQRNGGKEFGDLSAVTFSIDGSSLDKDEEEINLQTLKEGREIPKIEKYMSNSDQYFRNFTNSIDISPIDWLFFLDTLNFHHFDKNEFEGYRKQMTDEKLGSYLFNPISKSYWKTAIANTDLLVSVQLNREDLARKSLLNGASPNATCRFQKCWTSVCHIAIELGNDSILKLILEQGADRFITDDRGYTPFQIAAYLGNTTGLEILLNHKINDAHNMSLINAAASIIKQPDRLWLDAGTTIPERSDFVGSGIGKNNTALQFALSKLNVECAKSLLEAGARLCTCEGYQLDIPQSHRCAYTLDCCGSYFYCTNKIVDIQKDRFRETIKLIVEHGQKSTAIGSHCRSSDTSSAYKIAAVLGDEESIIMLLDAGYPSNTRHRSVEPAIYYSIQYNQINSLRLLGEADDMDKTTLESALEKAVIKNWKEGVAIILNCIIKKHVDGVYTRNECYKHLPIQRCSIYGLKNMGVIHDIVSMLKYNNSEDIHEITIKYRTLTIDELLLSAVKKCDHKYLKLFKENYTRDHVNKILDNPRYMEEVRLKDCVTCFKYLMICRSKEELQALTGMYSYFALLQQPLYLPSLKIASFILTRKVNKTMLQRARDSGCDMDGINLWDNETFEKLFISVYKNPLFCLKYKNSNTLLKYLFDSQVQMLHGKCSDGVVIIDYSLFLPHEDISKRRMSVVNKLFENDSRCKSLLLHPLVETFLHLQWKNVKNIFAVIVGIHLLLLFLLTCFVVDIYDDNSASVVWEICSWTIITCIVAMEITIMKNVNSIKGYVLRFEWWFKFVSLVLNACLLLDRRLAMDSNRHISRALSATTILVGWSNFANQLSNILGGFYKQTFAKMMERFAKILIVFGGFPILGFAFAFWILFQGDDQFNSWGDAIMKTVAMATSEFDYSSMFADKPFDLLLIVARIVFILFIGSVAIVIINLIVSFAVIDTSNFEKEWKIQRYLERIRLLSIFENITLPNPTGQYKKIAIEMPFVEGRLSMKAIKRHFGTDITLNIEKNISENRKSDKYVDKDSGDFELDKEFPIDSDHCNFLVPTDFNVLRRVHWLHIDGSSGNYRSNDSNTAVPSRHPRTAMRAGLFKSIERKHSQL